jgi:hypothetical protein
MSDRIVLELACSRAYDRGGNPLRGLNFPGSRGVRADCLQLRGRASVLGVEDGPM